MSASRDEPTAVQAAVQFCVLGPVEIRVGAQRVEVGPARRCAVLAALAVDAGRVVPVDVLVDRVWGSEPPEGARRTLHSYLTRIRRLVEAAGGCTRGPAQVRRRATGYLLDADPEQVDLHRFQRLVERAAEPARPAADQAALLADALAMWRGEPLTGVAGEWAGRTRHAWQQQHVGALVGWAQAGLRCGGAGPVIDRLTRWVGEYPLAEPLVVVLMQALHAAGRAADALVQFARLRQRLRDELGADPGPDLQATHQALLRGDLEAPTRPLAAPAQLPGDLASFVGRRDELTELDLLLAGGGRRAPARRGEPGAGQVAAVPIVAISGTAGVGKTTLAVHWAHQVAERFPDGQLYANLRGFDPGGKAVAPDEAVRGFLTGLGVPPAQVPQGLDAQSALYRSLLAGKRMLIVLDNARDADQVRPLLPGAPGCLVVVTSRSRLTGLVADHGARPFRLDLFTAAEARDLLAERLGPQRIMAERLAVERIVDACARLPLAVSIAAARAATQPGLPLAALADEVTDAGERLTALATGDQATDVRAVFSWSYRALSPAAARLFRLLGRHPGPDVSAPAAAGLACLPPAQVRPLLAELGRASLLAETGPGRYAQHDLLRAYAADLSAAEDPDADRRAATTRLLDHYLHTAHAGDRLLDPQRVPIPLPLAAPAPGSGPESFAGTTDALAWFAAEHPVLLGAVRLAGGVGDHTRAWQLGWCLTTRLFRTGHWHDLMNVSQAAVAAAGRLGDPVAEAHALRHHGRAEIQLGRYDESQQHLGRCIDLFGRAGDLVGQALAEYDVGYLWDKRGEREQGFAHLQRALALFRAAGDDRGQARVLNAVGWFQALRGEHAQALAACEQALGMLQRLGDRPGEADTWDSIGFAHHHLGQHDQAAGCYRHAVALFRDLGDRHSEATGLAHLADTHHAAGDLAAARAAWRCALGILTDLDHPDAAAVRARLNALDLPPVQTG